MSVGMLFGTASVAALLTGAYWGSGFIFSGWADNDRFFTKVKEGTGKVIVKGKTFHRAILSYAGHHLNEPGKSWHDPSQPDWEILPNEPDENYDDRMHLSKEFGLYWIGIPGQRSIGKYHLVWNEYEGVADGRDVVKHRDERTLIFMANSFTYVMVLENVKTKDNAPVRVEFTVILKVTNPYLAFATDDWMAVVKSHVNRIGRNFIGTFTYDELRSETDQKHQAQEGGADPKDDEEGLSPIRECERENFSKPVIDLTVKLPDENGCDKRGKPLGLKNKHGITIEAANLAEIDFFGIHAQKNEEASTEKYIAERRAEAVRTNADAAAYAVRAGANAQAHKTMVEGAADAGAIALKLQQQAKHPDLAKANIVGDAMGKPGDGKTIVIPSDLGKMLEGAFSGGR